MSKMTMEYLGDLQIKARHELSGVEIITDAPPDNQGQGRSFSPSDLTSTSLGACMMTIMGIVAKRHNIDLTAMKLSLVKGMSQGLPRRIETLQIDFDMPTGILHEHRNLLMRAAELCPVKQSLHPEVKITVNYQWN